MTLSDEDYFVLIRTVKGFKERLFDMQIISTGEKDEIHSMFNSLEGVIEELRK